jgi:hypothetical protein
MTLIERPGNLKQQFFTASIEKNFTQSRDEDQNRLSL